MVHISDVALILTLILILMWSLEFADIISTILLAKNGNGAITNIIMGDEIVDTEKIEEMMNSRMIEGKHLKKTARCFQSDCKKVKLRGQQGHKLKSAGYPCQRLADKF